MSNIDLLDSLPATLHDLLDLERCEKRPPGRLNTAMYRVPLNDDTWCYLNIGSGVGGVDLQKENARLLWLEGRSPVTVPTVRGFALDDGRTYLLTTEVEGVPSYSEELRGDMTRVVQDYALTLQEIHALDWSDCPFVDTVDQEIAEAERRLRDGEIDLPIFLEKSSGQTPGAVLDWLDEHRGVMDDLVFTHGDYCMPNVLMTEARVTGVVDWGLAGVADRHRDLFGVTDSLPMNYGEGWVPLFREAYGIDEIDPERIKYTNMLDWFFACHVL